MIRVLLADDHELVREGLAQILDENDGFSVVGHARDGAQVLAMTPQTDPDVIILDYSMPQTDTPTVIENLLRLRPKVKILILTVHENIYYAVRSLECGAHGYVIKSEAVRELVEAIQSVNKGEVYISPKVSQNLLQHLRKPKKDRAGLAALSSREFDLLRFLGSGMSLQDCARQMTISARCAARTVCWRRMYQHFCGQIVPVLERRCSSCHGVTLADDDLPDDSMRKLDLLRWPVDEGGRIKSKRQLRQAYDTTTARREDAAASSGFIDFASDPVASPLLRVPLALIAGAVMLLCWRLIDWRVPLYYFSGVAFLALVLPASTRMEGHAPWLAGHPLAHLLGGGTLLAGFFMLTDPTTSPMTSNGRIVFSLLAALYTMLVRFHTPYPDSVVLAVLFANASVPLIDRWRA